MPFVERDPDFQGLLPLGMPLEYAARPGGRETGGTETVPGWSEVFDASFRQENTIGSYLASESLRARATEDWDPSYNPWDDIVGTDYEEYWENFTHSHSRRHTLAIKADIARELDDRRTLEAAGTPSAIAGTVVASMLDWPALLPYGQLGKIVRAGGKIRVGRSALNVGTAAAVSTAIAEVPLHATQQTRTWEESAMNIGGSFVIGASLGGGMAKVF